MNWEILDKGTLIKNKIVVLWQNILAMRVVIEENWPGILEVELDKEPMFYHETDPRPRSHTTWELSEDFTGGQALTYRRHYLEFPPGVLEKHYEKLIQCDKRLLELSQRPFPSLKSPYFSSDLLYQGGATDYCHSHGYDLREWNTNPANHQQPAAPFHSSPTPSFSDSGSSIIGMEVSGQNVVTCDEEKALKCLLDAFGSAFSLEEIASAYCKASRNADLAGEILYEMQGSSSTSATPTHSSNADARVEESSESSDGSSFENSFQERKNIKPKVRPVSVGTVSGIIGKNYVRSMPSANGSYGVTKPLKLDVTALPMTGIWREKTKPSIVKHDQLHQDMEDFLFKMLGDGFQLDRDMIREVLDSCGYDMQKSMEKLLDRPIVALDKRTAAVGDSAARSTDMKPKSEVPSSERKSQNLRGNGNIVSNKGVELHQKQKERDDLQKEVLSALFNAPERSEESPRRTVKDVNKNSRYGHVVFEPPKDSMEEYKIDMNFSRRENVDDAEDEEDYLSVRRAVKEYRVTMNEYYKAAVDAFAKGDQFKAERLLDQGHFFLKKAREADEESSRMILETRTTEAQEMSLDLHDHGSKEAIRLLKCHLSSLSGIPSFEYLKVIIDANGEDDSKGSRRRLVLKLLEKESIKWVEGETAGTILIRLDSIERKRLSFLKT